MDIQYPIYIYWVLPLALYSISVARVIITPIDINHNTPTWYTILHTTWGLILIPGLWTCLRLYIKACKQFKREGDFIKSNYTFARDLIRLFKLPIQISGRFPWFKYLYYGSFIIGILAGIYSIVAQMIHFFHT